MSTSDTGEITRTIPVKEARKLCSQTQTATITEWDAWGKPTTWVIEWKPEIMEGHDLSMENIGYATVAYPDLVPVVTGHTSTGDVFIRSAVASVAASYGDVIEFRRVETAHELQPGTWRILSEDREPDPVYGCPSHTGPGCKHCAPVQD